MLFTRIVFFAVTVAKPIVVTLPLVLLVLDWFPLRRHLTEGWNQLLREKLEISVLVPPTPDIVGALGAALYALETNGGRS